jgi:hypothetical protein
MGVVPAAALAALLACAAVAAAAPSPIALKRIVAQRQASRFTLKIELDRSWTNPLFRRGSGTELRVLYDTNSDDRTDYTGRIVYSGGSLAETISGRGRRFEPVAVSRPSQYVAKFTHPVDVMFPNPSRAGALQITVVLHTAGKDDRLPRKGWFEVPAPPDHASSSTE